MDLLHDHLTMIHSKMADLIKAKETLMKKEKVHRDFQDFVIEQLAERNLMPLRAQIASDEGDQAMFAKRPL